MGFFRLRKTVCPFKHVSESLVINEALNTIRQEFEITNEVIDKTYKLLTCNRDPLKAPTNRVGFVTLESYNTEHVGKLPRRIQSQMKMVLSISVHVQSDAACLRGRVAWWCLLSIIRQSGRAAESDVSAVWRPLSVPGWKGSHATSWSEVKYEVSTREPVIDWVHP